MSTVTAVAGMVFSRMLNNTRVMERECRAGTNGANVSGRIHVIRRFVAFALKEIRTLRTPCRCRAQVELATCAGWSEYLGKIDVELPTTSFIPLGNVERLVRPWHAGNLSWNTFVWTKSEQVVHAR